MKKTFLIIITIIIVGILGWGLISNSGKDLINPNPSSPTQSPSPTPTLTPVPPQAPKTFQFDSSTDLKVEWEKVNPQILDSDFE